MTRKRRYHPLPYDEMSAWLLLASIWKQVRPPTTIGKSWYVEVMNTDETYQKCYGLCSTISELEQHGLSTWITGAMYQKIDNILDSTQSGYLWPKTRLGAKQRVKFCQEQVRPLKEAQ